MPKATIGHLNQSSSRGQISITRPESSLPSSAMTTSKAGQFPVESFEVPIGSRNYESGTHGNIAVDSRNHTENAFDGDRRRRAGGSHAPRNPIGESFEGPDAALDFHKADYNDT